MLIKARRYTDEKRKRWFLESSVGKCLYMPHWWRRIRTLSVYNAHTVKLTCFARRLQARLKSEADIDRVLHHPRLDRVKVERKAQYVQILVILCLICELYNLSTTF